MKNTKIMAVLVVLLAAMLFVGAASAAIPQGTQDVTLTAPETGVVGESVTFTLMNATGYDTVKGTYNLNYTTVEGGMDAATETTKVKTFPELTAGKSVSLTWTPAAPGTYEFGAFNTSDPEKYNATCRITVELPDGVREVTNQDDVFVYEHIFYKEATRLVKYSDGATPSVVNQISGASGIFYLTEDVVGGQYGTYNVTGEAGNLGTVSIWYPEISLQAELTTGDNGATSGDSIDGKTINKNTQVSFLINSPKVQPALADEEEEEKQATAKIVFTTPSGGQTTVFGESFTNDLDDIPLSGTQTIALGKGMTIGPNAEPGTWTAQAEYLTVPFDKYAKKSNTVTFTVQSTALAVSAAKDSVIRSNPFTVTIQGDSQMVYFVYLDGASASDVNPTLQDGQSGMVTTAAGPAVDNGAPLVDDTKQNLWDTWDYFETDASGKRTIQYNTFDYTEDKTYTVKVYATGMKKAAVEAAEEVNIHGKDYDSVKVKVEKGAVTISASGDGSYYIGDEITLSGTNTDSDEVHLFITGPNLKTNGEVLKQLPTHVAAPGDSPVSVKTDNTWEYKWDTSGCGLDTGAYTIYATSSSADKSDLTKTEYATVSVNLKQPFLSAVPSGTVVAKGDKIYIRGTAEGNPSTLALYIFGPNKYVKDSITVEDDGTYEKKLDISSEWSSNQYFVVIEHPMYNGVIDVDQVYYNGNTVVTKKEDSTYTTLEIKNFGNQTNVGLQASFIVEGTNKLQGSNAADALTKMIDSANIDDIYTKLTFTVAEPWIKIENPGDQGVDTKFTITGTTNLAVDDQILVEVVSSSFNAIDKTSTSSTSGISMTTKVVAGEGTDNVWSVEVDTTNWKLDEYTIKASGIEVDVSTTTNFNLVEKVVVTPTATATGATPTTTATATATTAPTQTPGFGAFIALAGLGAVALLVLRRN